MIKCMDMESSHGLMERVTKVSTYKTKNKEKEDSTMEMDHITRVTGIRDDNMGEASSRTRAGRYMKADMSMVS